jgi:hypothetical protein
MPMNTKLISLKSVIAVAALFIMLLATISGCEEEVVAVDVTPPAVPNGVFSVTGDQVVTVYWNDIYYDEVDDLVGYLIYRFCPELPGDSPEVGPYCLIAEVAWDENYDSSSLVHWFDDYDVTNGETYYYAVSAFDAAGNPSALSFELVGDTPRPEGIEVKMFDLDGYDFSSLGGNVIDWDSQFADIFVEYDENIPFVHVARPGVLIQDYGLIDLLWVDWAPSDGYSNTGVCELIEGHSYILRIVEPLTMELHFAKFWVYDITSSYVEIDWAYQIDPNNPELSTPDSQNSGNRKTDVVRF